MSQNNSITGETCEGKLIGMIVSCTGHEPHDEEYISKIIIRENGIVGNEGIWQQEQIVVVGRVGFSRQYLEQSIEIGKRFNFTCRYMSQEDFLYKFLEGREVNYSVNDPHVLNHRGLSFLRGKRVGWPMMVTRKVPWEILPPGKYPFSRILDCFRGIRGIDERTIKIAEERLLSIRSLNPSIMYTGKEGFRQYIVFYFQERQKAILECPIYGNAIYVIDGNWEELSKCTKAELRWYFSDVTKIIPHKGNWLLKVSKILYS